jgi:hypothetical protein
MIPLSREDHYPVCFGVPVSASSDRTRGWSTDVHTLYVLVVI